MNVIDIRDVTMESVKEAAEGRQPGKPRSGPRFAVLRDQPPTLEQAQKFVGGLVEVVTLHNGDQILVHEEGLFVEGGPIINRPATIINRAYGHRASVSGEATLVGNCLLLTGDARWD